MKFVVFFAGISGCAVSEFFRLSEYWPLLGCLTFFAASVVIAVLDVGLKSAEVLEKRALLMGVGALLSLFSAYTMLFSSIPILGVFALAFLLACVIDEVWLGLPRKYFTRKGGQ